MKTWKFASQLDQRNKNVCPVTQAMICEKARLIFKELQRKTPDVSQMRNLKQVEKLKKKIESLLR